MPYITVTIGSIRNMLRKSKPSYKKKLDANFTKRKLELMRQYLLAQPELSNIFRNIRRAKTIASLYQVLLRAKKSNYLLDLINKGIIPTTEELGTNAWYNLAVYVDTCLALAEALLAHKILPTEENLNALTKSGYSAWFALSCYFQGQKLFHQLLLLNILPSTESLDAVTADEKHTTWIHLSRSTAGIRVMAHLFNKEIYPSRNSTSLLTKSNIHICPLLCHDILVPHAQSAIVLILTRLIAQELIPTAEVFNITNALFNSWAMLANYKFFFRWLLANGRLPDRHALLARASDRSNATFLLNLAANSHLEKEFLSLVDSGVITNDLVDEVTADGESTWTVLAEKDSNNFKHLLKKGFIPSSYSLNAISKLNGKCAWSHLILNKNRSTFDTLLAMGFAPDQKVMETKNSDILWSALAVTDIGKKRIKLLLDQNCIPSNENLSGPSGYSKLNFWGCLFTDSNPLSSAVAHQLIDHIRLPPVTCMLGEHEHSKTKLDADEAIQNVQLRNIHYRDIMVDLLIILDGCVDTQSNLSRITFNLACYIIQSHETFHQTIPRGTPTTQFFQRARRLHEKHRDNVAKKMSKEERLRKLGKITF